MKSLDRKERNLVEAWADGQAMPFAHAMQFDLYDLPGTANP